MDCPHCHEENLVGSKLCASCGTSMMSAPPEFVVSPTVTQFPQGIPARIDDAQPAPTPMPSAPVAAPAAPAAHGPPLQAFCRVCMEGFARTAGEKGLPLCPTCRQFAPVPGGDATKNEVQLHPATQAQPGVDPRAGSAIRRVKPVQRRVTLRVGPVVAVLGLAIGVIGMGVVTFVGRETDPAAAYLADARPEPATFAVTPTETEVVRLESTLTLGLVREMTRANFANQTEKVLNLRQTTVQTADVAWVRDDPRGVVIDAAVECRVAVQTGSAGGTDGRDARVHPWDGHRATARLVVPAAAATQVLGGDAAVVGRDVVPCLTVRDIGAPSGSVAAGATWRATVMLPFAMSREGAIRAVSFPCELTYHGNLRRSGVKMNLFGLRGTVPAHPSHLLDEMNRAGVKIRGALLFDATTGLLAQANLTADVSAWLDRGRIEDLVHLTGTLDVKRR